MQVVDYTRNEMMNSVLGTFTVELDKWGGFRLKLKHIKGKNGHFVAFPSTKEQEEFVPLMYFSDPELSKKFLSQAKEALGIWLRDNPEFQV